MRSAAEGDEGTLFADDRAVFTARIATRTPAAAGVPIELAVHHEGLHYFDPESGAALNRQPARS